jgi:hypothetical protein
MCNAPLYNSSINTSRRSFTLQRRMAKGIARNIQVDFISSFGFRLLFYPQYTDPGNPFRHQEEEEVI